MVCNSIYNKNKLLTYSRYNIMKIETYRCTFYTFMRICGFKGVFVFKIWHIHRKTNLDTCTMMKVEKTIIYWSYASIINVRKDERWWCGDQTKLALFKFYLLLLMQNFFHFVLSFRWKVYIWITWMLIDNLEFKVIFMIVCYLTSFLRG